MIKAFIFDNDGVLVDSEVSQIAAWEHFFSLHHKTFPERQLHLMTRGRPAKEVIAAAFPDLSRGEINAYADKREEIHMAMLKKGIREVGGVHHFLEEAKKAGMKLAIGTSGRHFKLDYILDTLGIRDYFDVLITSEDVEKGKPAPDIFLAAAMKLDRKPEECIVFEDALTGVEAALRAGMKTVVLTTSHAKDEFKSDNIVAFCPDFSAANRKKIMSIIKTLP